MAGESPDKSDKKQSSGKTARNERDPRLSAFRGEPDESAQASDAGKHPKPADDGAEAAAESKSEAKPEPVAAAKSASAGKPAPASEAESSAEPVGGSEPAAGTEAEPGAGSASEDASEEPQDAAEGGAGAEGGDARLRAAVAAWVAGTGDEDGEGAEGAEVGEGGDGDAGDGDAGAAAASEAEVRAEADVDAESAAGSGEASGAGAGAGAGAAAKPEAKSGAKADAKADAKPGAKSGAKSAAKSAAKQSVKSEAKADADSEADADGETDADGDAGRGGSKDGAKSQSEAKPQPKGKAEPQSKGGPEGKSDSEGKPASSSKAEVVDQPTAVFKTVGPQKGKPGGAAGAASERNGDGTGGGEAAEAEEPAVDEATRVFAFAKSKKGAEAEAVDQATTAFKISPPAKDGDAAKSKAKDKPESKGKADAKTDAKDKNAEGKDADGKNEAKAAKVAERDSERTSQFVALKSADDGTAGKSLGKTAPKTPARTPDKAADKPGDEAADKPADKSAGKSADKPEGKVADKAAGKADKAGAKPAGKATGALPAAEPAKPAAAPKPKPADRPGTKPSATTGATAAAPAELPEAERTKQQPLPPLDLLAQLTNTPPPPETPLRSVVRRFKIWTPLAVLLVIIFVVAQAVRPLPAPELAVGGSTGFTFEGGQLSIPWPNQGQAAVKVVGVGNMGTSGEAKPVPTASVAKVMTAYVILRDHPLKKGEKGETIKVDAQAEADSQKRDESRVTLKKGQKFTQYQMLQMLMIPSGNNAARQLARWDAGSEKAFAKKMQAAAKDLGMTKTTYTDPSGLDASTKSTAVDQLKLAEEVMKNDAFREVVRTENVQIQGLPEKIYNNNSLLTTMAGKVAGIKTGSSTPAGGTFMWAGYRTVGDKTPLLIGVTMDQHVSGPDPNGSSSLPLALNNTSKVITGVRDALTSATVVKKGQVVGYVDDGLGGETPVVATKNLSAVGWAGMKAKFSMSDAGKTIPHTAKAGTVVGVLTVGDGESAQKVPVALKQDLAEPGFGAKLIRIS
ncbi:D-alanyl-D-alanine carboxypeptidase [Streptomyces sp. RPA4-5]|nr:D-alanyl-D-alanine carboxypeptidase [Streptomyces sp. RPA4-5]